MNEIPEAVCSVLADSWLAPTLTKLDTRPSWSLPATRAPSATNSRAVAKPMPLLPPVIKAVLVSSFIFGVVIEFGFALPILFNYLEIILSLELNSFVNMNWSLN
jgi:hypothetical protein